MPLNKVFTKNIYRISLPGPTCAKKAHVTKLKVFLAKDFKNLITFLHKE